VTTFSSPNLLISSVRTKIFPAYISILQTSPPLMRWFLSIDVHTSSLTRLLISYLHYLSCMFSAVIVLSQAKQLNLFRPCPLGSPFAVSTLCSSVYIGAVILFFSVTAFFCFSVPPSPRSFSHFLAHPLSSTIEAP